MHTTMFLIIAGLNIPLYFLLGKSFFGGWEGLFESIVAMITPDVKSALSGDYDEHRIGRFTFIMYLIVCSAVVLSEYHVVAKYFFGIEKPWG